MASSLTDTQRAAAELSKKFSAATQEATMTRAWVALDDVVAAVLRGDISNGLAIAGSLAVWRLRHEK